MGNDRFYAVTGMPIDKVQQYQNATSCQKRYAKCFDTNKNGIFDQNEVDLFNATTFSRKKDNTVIFYTQVKENTWWFPKNEKVATKFEDNPNKIKFDTKNKNIRNRNVIPYNKTHLEGKDVECLNKGGVEFCGAESYQEVYHNNKYMNKVTMKNGTSIIYPNGQEKGLVWTRPEEENETTFRYHPTNTGNIIYNYDTQEYKTEETGYYLANEKVETGNYITSITNIKNATIINSKNNNKYRFNNCKNYVVIQGSK